MTAFLTTAFIFPIYQSHSLPLRRLAIRSAICSVVGFISTAFVLPPIFEYRILTRLHGRANLSTLVALGGEQLGFISSGSCALDGQSRFPLLKIKLLMICVSTVFINATLLHIIVGMEQEIEVERVSHPKPYGAYPGISIAIDRALESTRERETYLSGIRTDRESMISARIPRGDEIVTKESKASD